MKLRAVCSHEDEFLSGQSPVGIAADEFRDSHIVFNTVFFFLLQSTFFL